MRRLLLALCTHHHESLISRHIIALRLYFLFCSHCAPFFFFFLLPVMTYRGMLHILEVNKMFPPASLLLQIPLHSFALCLSFRRLHVGMFAWPKKCKVEPRPLQCALCTIYMKYIFIHDMQAHEIAPLSFLPCLSYAFSRSMCSLRKSFEWKHWSH